VANNVQRSVSLGGVHERLAPPGTEDLICFSHLRWNFVFQRPQHLMTRCAAERRVFFIEEPIFDSDVVRMDVVRDPSGVKIVVPRLPPSAGSDAPRHLRELLDSLLELESIREYVLWYYTPMAMSFTDHLEPRAVVFDCMDELSAFAGAPRGLRDAERALLHRADVVFTGGQSLYEAKRRLHANVHPFPSSVDVAHFGRARSVAGDPFDQTPIPRPRLGFFGVVDERFDVPLVTSIAGRRPDWHFVIIGPVVKIDPASLPRLANIHYLGQKAYAELPGYIAGWDVALLPFARNDATRFISPTKTPEYLAAGKPVVSTSIRDVVRPYGERGIVRIADTPDAFIDAVQAALIEAPAARLSAADALLAGMSWDFTWASMSRMIRAACDRQTAETRARFTRSGEQPSASA
jgi:UDP-galactopyranose mutase